MCWNKPPYLWITFHRGFKKRSWSFLFSWWNISETDRVFEKSTFPWSVLLGLTGLFSVCYDALLPTIYQFSTVSSFAVAVCVCQWSGVLCLRLCYDSGIDFHGGWYILFIFVACGTDFACMSHLRRFDSWWCGIGFISKGRAVMLYVSCLAVRMVWAQLFFCFVYLFSSVVNHVGTLPRGLHTLWLGE